MYSFENIELTDQNLKSLQKEINEKYEMTIDVYGKPTKLKVGDKELYCLKFLLRKIQGKFEKEITEVLVDFTKDLFKALRNCMVLNEENQNNFANDEDALNNVKSILHILTKDQNSKNWFGCIKIIYQFLINLVVGNESSSLKVWKTFSNNFVELCRTCDSYYTSALLYNILMKHPTIALSNNIYETIFDLFEKRKENEYVIFLIEFFLKNDNICDRYIKFKLEHRIIILEMLKQKIIVKRDDSFDVSQKQVLIFTSEFKKKSDCILKTVPDYLKNIDAQEVALLLEVLASLSSQRKHLEYMQSDKSLLINCTYLLKSIHEVGKQSENTFTPIQKLSEMNSTRAEGSAAFGFKADLIRLIGNMCWKHKGNQDSLREMDGIPLILDCCNIDARNPFIMQWSILAMRNLCEKNLENQKVIASLKQQGAVDSKVLQELGITLHGDEENTLHIVPFDELKRKLK